MTDNIKDLILLNCEQGGDEWHNARMGIPTASQFKRIITGKGEQSRQSYDYMAELVAEAITGKRKDVPVTEHMQRGIELEDAARGAYEFETGSIVVEVGGVFVDETHTILASPDGLVFDMKKGIEIKCPKLETHIKYCLYGVLPSEHKMQVHGGIWVCKFDEWDFVSYCPEYTPQPLFIHTVKRDESLIKAMDKHIIAFSKTLEAHKQQIGY